MGQASFIDKTDRVKPKLSYCPLYTHLNISAYSLVKQLPAVTDGWDCGSEATLGWRQNSVPHHNNHNKQDTVPALICRTRDHDIVQSLLIRPRAANDPLVFEITEKAPTRAFSWVKAPSSTFTFIYTLSKM